jgi:hypothetical protein
MIGNIVAFLLSNPKRTEYTKSMISIRLCVLLILCFGTLTSLSIGRTISFTRNNDEIWIADESGKNAKFICKGRDPDIDPSGSFVAYTVNTNSSRLIGIAGICSGTRVIMKSILGTNSFGPKWNHTGDRLLFSWFDNAKAQWQIGTVKAFSDTEFRLLNGLQFTSDTCTVFNKVTVCHDGEGVYLLSSDGQLTEKYSLARFGNLWSSNIDSALAYSDDGSFILYAAIVPGEFLGSLGEANSALFVLDAQHKDFKRLTLKNICAMNPIWFSKDLILFEGFTVSDIKNYKKTGESAPSTRRLYLIDRNGNNLRPFIEDASQPSISRAK